MLILLIAEKSFKRKSIDSEKIPIFLRKADQQNNPFVTPYSCDLHEHRAELGCWKEKDNFLPIVHISHCPPLIRGATLNALPVHMIPGKSQVVCCWFV